APTTWEDLATRIIEKFHTFDQSQKARVALDQIKQHTSVQDFIARFDDIVAKITDLHISEETHRFFQGLKPEIRNEMERRKISDDLPAMKQAAQSYDALLFKQRTANKQSTRPSQPRPRPTQRQNNFRNFHQIEKKPEAPKPRLDPKDVVC